MAIRDDILANVTTSLTGTSCGVSSELPWNSGDTPLYVKNMKKFYLSEAEQDITTLHNTFDLNDVYQTETTLTGYLSVDAKNQPSDINSIVSAVINSRLSVASNFIRECDVTSAIDNDRVNYEFNFRFVKV